MIDGVLDQWSRLPGVRHELGRLADRVLRGTSLLLLCGSRRTADLVEQWLRVELESRDRYLRSFQLPELGKARKPAEIALTLAGELASRGEGNGAAWKLEELLPRCEHDEVVHLEGWRELDDETRRTWLGVFLEWSRATHSAAVAQRRCPPAVCVADIPASAMHLQGELYFEVAYWPEHVSLDELAVICRAIEADPEEDCAHWRECVLPSIAGSDPGLLSHLWDAVVNDGDALLNGLLQYAELQGWTARGVRDALRRSARRSHELAFGGSREPRLQFECPELCLAGLLVATREYGWELHTAALRLLEDYTALSYRRWRGQAGLLLPELEATRLWVNRLLSDRYGADWAIRWERPDDPVEAEELENFPESVSWGRIAYLLRKIHSFRRETQVAELAWRCKSLRNQLAHGGVVEFQEFCDFRKATRKLRETI